LWQSNAIVRFIAQQGNNPTLVGSTPFQKSLIDQWIDFSYHEIDLPVCSWLAPISGYIQGNPIATKKAKTDLNNVLGILDSHLLHHTFLVGERISLADIVVSTSLLGLYTTVLDENFRKKKLSIPTDGSELAFLNHSLRKF